MTGSCNLDCVYCTYGELYEGNETRNRKRINIHNAKKLLLYIIDLKKENKINKLNISFYGGEPLLNFFFIRNIIEFTNQLNAEKKNDIFYSMTTNATLIHKHIEFLVANKFDLFISLDGNLENHGYRVFKNNKKNSFEKLIENIDLIQRDYYDYFVNHVKFLSVLHNRNSVKDIFEFINTRYNKIPIISELSHNNLKPDKKAVFETMYLNKRKSEIEFQQDESNLLHKTIYKFSYYELYNFLNYLSINFYISNITSMLIDIENYFPTSTCFPFARKIFLTSDNRLLPCERINFKYSFGEVNKNVIIDIPTITKQYNYYYDHLKKVCENCYAYKFCGLCMFHISNLDKLDKEEFICDHFCDYKAFQNKMYRIFSFLEKYPNDFFQILENIKPE